MFDEALLRDKWAAGEKSADIGVALGLPAVEVRRIARRLELPHRDGKLFQKRRRRKGHKPHRAFNREAEVKLEYHPTAPVPERVYVTDMVRVAFADRQRHQCAWPIGDPRDATFGCCGATVRERGSNYCETHHERAFEPMSKRLSDSELMKGVSDKGMGMEPLARRDILHARGTR